MTKLLLILLCAVTTSSNRIDQFLDKAHVAAEIQPAPICDDATFLRRASLDLIGRIPTLDELDNFLASSDLQKRSQAIDRLLKDPLFSRRFAEVWTAALIGFTQETPADRVVLMQWLDRQLTMRRSFKQIATSMIAAEGQSAVNGPVNFVVRHGEDTGVQVCRQFLGIRLDCARCHDHPFAKWTQDDFESMTRFFESVRTEEVTEGNIRVSGRPIRESEETLPRFLSGARPRTSQWRAELALFVTRSKPFARNFVNRVWYDLMGRGIVDPPDDFNTENEPASRELLEWLASDAKEHNFDIRRIYRLIGNSKAYQRVSISDAFQGSSTDVMMRSEELRLFARRIVKPLTPEQIYDSRSVATGNRESRTEFLREYRGETFDEEYVQTWKFRETIQTMLEQVTSDADIKTSVPSTAVAYRCALSREPTAKEREACRGWSPKEILATLLQTNEFVFNR